MTAEIQDPEEPLQPVFEGESALRCALDSTGSKMAIVAKTGGYYDSKASEGFLYILKDLQNVEEPFKLEGSFEHAGQVIFTSDDRFLLASFASEAFGSSPSICAYDSEFGIPIAWFVSPLNHSFHKIAVPFQRCAKFAAVDTIGKLYHFHIEEA